MTEYRVIEHFADKAPEVCQSLFLDVTPKIGDEFCIRNIKEHNGFRPGFLQWLVVVLDIDYTCHLIELHVQNALTPRIELYKSNYDAPGCDSDGEYL